jgi:hypothetical protein
VRTLSDTERRLLETEGYVLLPGIVPAERVRAALRAINASLGGVGIPPDRLVQFRAQSFCPELQQDPVVVDLYQATAVREVAESLIGPGRIRPVRGAQIALRFPTLEAPRPPVPHLDGMHTPTNGVPEGTIANFTALVGVFLSDVLAPDSGNFTVWPGSHLLYAQYFREHGPESLLRGMPPVELPAPRQVLARAGDAVICHYLLGHGVASNASPFVRYAVFFRLSHVDHDAMKWTSMTDPWLEWEGLRAARA